jgi:hypothetical protein
MKDEIFNTLTQYFKGLIEERQHGDNAISSTLTALKASVWIEPRLSEYFFSIICNVHRGFRWGCLDMSNLLRQIKYNYWDLFDYDRVPEMAFTYRPIRCLKIWDLLQIQSTYEGLPTRI